MPIWLLQALAAMFVAAVNPAPAALHGSSPQLALDALGTIRMIFGRGDSIFVVTSTDQGKSFGAAAVVGVVSGMHLGNTRGPVIASASTRSVVAAGDKAGNIHLFQLDHAIGKWRPLVRMLNDRPASAPEGLVALAADEADGFIATWLDTRIDGHDQVYFARSIGTGADLSWTPNVRVNVAALGNACECCRPSVAGAGGTVAVMFRNNIGGSRDMYLARSADRGRTFATAIQLGRGTWKLDACPMDGGAMQIAASGEIATVWRRENTVYAAHPGQPEAVVGAGRSPMLSIGPRATLVIWQDRNQIRLKSLTATGDMVVGEGRLPQVLALADGSALTAWEKGDQVFYRRIEAIR